MLFYTYRRMWYNNAKGMERRKKEIDKELGESECDEICSISEVGHDGQNRE